MGLKRMAASKNGYQSILWIYIDRLDKLKKNNSGKCYTSRQKKLALKIKIIKSAIKRYDEKINKLSFIDSCIEDFFYCSVKLTGGRGIDVTSENGKNASLARKVFYKYCLENGLSCKYISEYCGVHKDTVRISRMNFTRSFKTNAENKSTYHLFLKNIKNTPCQEFNQDSRQS